MSSRIENVVIVGTGCAGLTAAIYTGRANLQPLVLEGSLPGGQLTTTSEVENFPGFPEGIDGYQLMQNLRKQAEKFGTRYESGTVQGLDTSQWPYTLKLADREIRAKIVIVATGASPRLTGIPGEKELYGGKGVTTCATCDGAFYRKMDVAVIGGGDSAAEEAMFLTRFASKVYLVHRRDSLRASKIMAERVTSHPKIQCVWDSVPVSVEGVAEGAVSGLKVKNVKTGAESVLPVKGVFVAIGHIPNTGPFKSAVDTDDEGYFVPTGHSQVKTRTPGVYVAGDCADHHYRQAITAAGMGCQAAIEAERWLTSKVPESLKAIWAGLGIPADYAVARHMPLQSEAKKLTAVGRNPDRRTVKLTPRAAAAWRRMRLAAARDGLALLPISGFRSVARQARIIRQKLKAEKNIADILRFVAAPGCSEHHTGRALDVGSPDDHELDESFARTAEFRWLKKHAGKFGFHLTYPRKNPHGIGYEPWHWCWSAARKS